MLTSHRNSIFKKYRVVNIKVKRRHYSISVKRLVIKKSLNWRIIYAIALLRVREFILTCINKYIIVISC